MRASILTIFIFFLTLTGARAQIETITSDTFRKDAACGQTKTCFSDCDNSGSCSYEVSCSLDGSSTTASCTITGKVNSGDVWMATAFSSDATMGGDSVTGCKYVGGQATIYNAKTTGKTRPTDIANDGVSLTSYEKKDNILRCMFDRLAAQGVNGDRFDLTQAWHWFFASGAVGGSLIQFHSKYVASAQTYDLTALQATQTPNSGPASIDTITSNTFRKDAACGQTKTCFSDCDNSGSCSYEVSCSLDGSSTTASCTITGKVNSGDVWMAMAFSSDASMGGDSVTGCKFAGGQATIYNAKTTTKTRPTDIANDGVTLTGHEKKDNILRCMFDRLAAQGVNGDRFDLTQAWHWLFASGSLSGSQLQFHSKFVPSAQAYDLTAAPVTQDPNQGPAPTQPPPSSSGSVVKDPACGTSKGCFTVCEGDACSLTAVWSPEANAQTALYTLRADVGSSSGSFIALGFSADGDMGDDDVIGCVGLGDGTVRAFSAENQGKNPNLYTDNSVILVQGQMSDGVLSCDIQRKIAGYTVGTYTRRDIAQPWTLLMARGSGSVSNGDISISYHTPNGRFVSSQPFTVNDVSDDAAEIEEFPMIKLHGSLMIGAWVFLASIGIVAARYYKEVWPGTMCSEKVWFQIHRTCMVLVFCTCVAGFVVIFVETEEWIEIEEKPSYLKGHPIMGTIVTGLCVLNPLMALIRPHPGTKNRPIFNWAHWFVGTGAHILGVVTIFFGFELDKADAPTYLKYILAGYVAWQCFVELLLEMMACCCTKKDRSEAYELSSSNNELVNKNNATGTQSEGVIFAKRTLFVLHFFVVTAITAVLIALLVVGKRELDS